MQTYLVGGAVRDTLLGLTPKEHDYVVVGATPQMMIDMGYTPVGKDFPVFLHPQTKDEYALARTERKSGPGYTGFTCYAAPDVTLEDDLKRRDLTINAIAQDSSGKLIDPYKGLTDLEQRVLRHVSPAFSEDPLRILRIARFAARFHHLGFTIADDTLKLMRSMVANGELRELTAERVWQEISRSLTGPAPDVFFQVLKTANSWPDLFNVAQISIELSTLARLRPKSAEHMLLPDIAQRFTILCVSCSSQDVETDKLIRHLSAHWRVSKSCKELAVLVNVWWQMCQKHTPWNSKEICQLMQRSDPIRRAERWQQVLSVLNFLSHGQEALHYQVSQLTLVAKAYVGADIKSLVEQNLRGPELANAIQSCREQAVARVLTEPADTSFSPPQSN